MVPASGQSIHLHRTLPGPSSPSHMPAQAVANPPKLVGLGWRAAGWGEVRTRCTTCNEIRKLWCGRQQRRCDQAITVVVVDIARKRRRRVRPIDQSSSCHPKTCHVALTLTAAKLATQNSKLKTQDSGKELTEKIYSVLA